MTEATAKPADLSHIKLAVPFDEIDRLRVFISTEETRYYLNGVKFEAGTEGVLLAATDGHRLGVRNVADAIVNGDGIVRLPKKPKAEPHQRKGKLWLVVGDFAGATLGLVMWMPDSAKAADAAERATLPNALLIQPRPLIDGSYPEWRRVIPAKIGKRSASFNSRYLGDFTKATEGKGATLTLYGDSENEPHIVTVGDSQFLGVQMPMRADGIAELPSWLAEPAKPKRKKAA